MTARLSILIISYNRIEDTLALLQNIALQKNLLTHTGEILLLNNASTISYEVISEFVENHPDLPIKYIHSDKNLGVAGGRNFLAQKAAFPYLLVLDDDVILPDQDAVEKIAGLLEKPLYRKNNTGIITLNIYYFSNGQRQKSALPHKKYEEFKDKSWFWTYYFTGAAHVMKKEVFEKTGYYPEDFFYGMEEYDLSYRTLNVGYRIAYDSTIKVLHKESPLGRVTPKEKISMMWFNKCKVAWKYLPDRYFYTTAFMWSLEYLKRTRGDVKGFLQTWRRVLIIPQKVPKEKVNNHTLQYLKKVRARLWY